MCTADRIVHRICPILIVRARKRRIFESIHGKVRQSHLEDPQTHPKGGYDHLITVLRPGRFADSLAMHPAADMDDL